MSSYLDRYKSRVGQTDLISNTKSANSNSFESHPFYSLVDIDGIQTGVIVAQEKTSDDKQILLKPDTKINIGAVVKINELNYLAMDFLGEGINEIYPTATLKLCNATFPIQTNKTKVLVGYDKLNRPLYDEVETVEQQPCIVETKYYYRGMIDQITIPQDNIIVTLKYQVSPSIATNQEFDMYDSRYAITFIDHSKVVNGKGIMTIQGERVNK